MWFRNLFHAMTIQSARASAGQARSNVPRDSRHTRSLQVESLEERRVLALVLAGANPVGDGAQAIVAADFNNDGRLDLATANLDDNSVSVLLGNGDATFGTARDMPAGDFTAQFDGNRKLSVVVGDFNGDGNPDLATLFLEEGGDYWSSWGAGRVDVLFGNGDGTFLPPLNVFAPEGGDYPIAIQVDDVNGDGRSDLGVYNTSTYYSWSPYWVPTQPYHVVLLGSSTNSFTTVYDDGLFPIPDDSNFVRNGDLNVDGHVDQVRGIGSSVEVRLGRPDGTLGSALSSPVGHFVSAVAVGDFNGDSRPDVAAASDTGHVSVLLNDGIWPRADAPTIQIGNADPLSVVEGHSGIRTATFTVTLSAAYDEVVTVDYRTEDGTTTANSDYQAQSGTLVFAPGETSKTITITIYGDTQVEGDEYFWVLLSNSSQDALIKQPTGFGNIQDDDGESTIDISDAEIVEGNSGTRLMTFTITLSHASNQEVRVSYNTANGTARTSDSDYVSRSGTITFAPGETTKTITVKVRGDKKIEADEYFSLNLSGAVNGRIDDGEGTGTIVNDDVSRTRSDRRTAAAATDAALLALLTPSFKRRR